jgi:hypothetical protein
VSADLPDSAAVWWGRLNRVTERMGPAGSKIKSDWANEMVQVLSPCDELVDGRWQPPTPEQHTEEYKAAETKRLCDELGRTLGVGPYPGQPYIPA